MIAMVCLTSKRLLSEIYESFMIEFTNDISYLRFAEDGRKVMKIETV